MKMYVLLLIFLLAQPAVHDTSKAVEHTIASVAKGVDGPWKEDGVTLKPCWKKEVFGKLIRFLKDLELFVNVAYLMFW